MGKMNREAKEVLQTMINNHSEELGNYIADFLMLVELKSGKKNIQLRNLLDKYADEADKSLDKYRINMLRETESLLLRLSWELEKFDKPLSKKVSTNDIISYLVKNKIYT